MENYTESWAADRIKEYLYSRKDQLKVLEHLSAKCRGVFPFNPTDATEQVLDIFLDDPDKFKTYVKEAVRDIVSEWHDDERVKSMLNNVPVVITESTKIKLNEWNSKYEGIPVLVECQVVGVYKEETYTKKAEAFCVECSHREDIKSLSNLPLCPNKDCTYHKKHLIVDQKSIETGDIRTVLIEEPIEESKSSSPAIKECVIKDEAVLETFMGNKKKIIGIFRSHPQRGKSTNRPMIHAISVDDLADSKPKMPTPEQIKKFRDLSLEAGYFDILTASWAPEIKFEDLAKLCVILAVVGGVKVDMLRGIINAFLVGDPGTGKSKILEFLLSVIQKSALAVGGTMSGSGVTVTMDTLPNRTKLPRAGIVPLCHGSAVALDELNQLEDEDLGKLYEAMESGVIHYNKGGFDEIFKAETTIIAGANPKGYEYDSEMGMLSNIGLPSPLVTRFDLIVNMLRSKSSSDRAAIRKHILYIRKHGVAKYVQENDLLTALDLTLLINYARTFNPEFTDEAEDILDKFQTKMEDLQDGNEQVAGAKKMDNRTFESLYRIATAIARIHFLDSVTKECAESAVEIYTRTLRTFGVKTEKGMTQLNMQDAVKDWNTAAEFTWRKMEQEENTNLLDGVRFAARLMKDHPTYFKSGKDVDKWFLIQKRKGRIIMQGMMYKLVD